MISHIVYRTAGATKKNGLRYMIASVQQEELPAALKRFAPCQGFNGIQSAREVENCLNDHYRVKEEECTVCDWKAKEPPPEAPKPESDPEKETGLFE